MRIDMRFPIRASGPVIADHGFALYSALSRALPWIHENNEVGVHPIAGRQNGNRGLLLDHRSRLELRLPTEVIGNALQLAGSDIQIGKTVVHPGTPTVHKLQPASQLRSRLVTIKGMMDEISFLSALKRQLATFGCSKVVEPCVGKRRTLRIHHKEVVGFEVIVDGLTAMESIVLQEKGAGGRRRFGCGVFVPFLSTRSMPLTLIQKEVF